MKPPKLRVLCFGMNSPYSSRPFAALAQSHSIVGIVEGMPRGTRANAGFSSQVKRLVREFFRGLRTQELQFLARQISAPYFQLRDDNKADLLKFVRDCAPDLICIASFPRLIKADVLQVPPFGVINLHSSLLPKYRGPNTWFWMYFDMEPVGGVTVHFVDEGEDTGDILGQRSYEVPLGMSWQQMFNQAVTLGETLLPQVVDQIAAGTHQPVRQSDIPTNSRARRVQPTESLIDWTEWGVERVFHLLRGTYPGYRAIPAPNPYGEWTITGYEKLSLPPDQRPGAIYREADKAYVACRDGRVWLSCRYSLRTVLSRVMSTLL